MIELVAAIFSFVLYSVLLMRIHAAVIEGRETNRLLRIMLNRQAGLTDDGKVPPR
jgi:Ni,Fe-hydrogenase I cytochrome b subunit